MLATSQDVPSSFVDGPLQARLPKTDTVMEWKQSSGPFQYGNVVEEVQIYGIYHKEVSRQGRQEPHQASSALTATQRLTSSR